MVQHTCQFGGLPHDDQNEHISSFFKICDTQMIYGVSVEVIKLKLFPFSLKDKANTWFNSFPKNTIATWDEMAYKFLTKYFSPSKATKPWGDFTTFSQFESKNIYEAWERYKGLIRKIPYHDFRLGWRSNSFTMDWFQTPRWWLMRPREKHSWVNNVMKHMSFLRRWHCTIINDNLTEQHQRRYSRGAWARCNLNNSCTTCFIDK